MSQVDRGAAFWTRKAPGYAKSKIKDMASYTQTMTATRAYLDPGHVVLELGCGTGSTALYLARAVAGYVGTDVSEGMIEIARGKARDSGHQILFETCGVSEAPAGPFDRVLAYNLLHLLPDLEADLGAIRDRLPPGGLFISKTPCLPDGPAPFSFRAMMFVLPALQAVGQAPLVRLRSVTELETAITAAGFEIVVAETHNPSPPSRFVVARRV